MNSLIELKKAIPLFLTVGLLCFAFSPTVQAVSPAPDGGYANFNTAEGTDALFNLTSGDNNTAIGFDALFSNTIGRGNTAIGLKHSIATSPVTTTQPTVMVRFIAIPRVASTRAWGKMPSIPSPVAMGTRRLVLMH